MKDRFCSACGGRVMGEPCCWFMGETGRARPYPPVAAMRWEEWDADEQFLIRFVMERFGGAAAEWELLQRLPWRRERLDRCVGELAERLEGTGEAFPCFRERDDRGRGWRYFLSDLARASYEASLRSE